MSQRGTAAAAETKESETRAHMPMNLATTILAVTAALALLCGAALLTIMTRLNHAIARGRGE